VIILITTIKQTEGRNIPSKIKMFSGNVERKKTKINKDVFVLVLTVQKKNKKEISIPL